jgi:MFS family permease
MISVNSSEKRFPQHFRWNFGVYMVDMISFFFAGSFFNADTVVASMLGQATSAAPLVGLAGTIYRLGWTVPQLVAAHVLRRQPRKKPYLVPGVIGRLVSLVALAVAMDVQPQQQP